MAEIEEINNTKQIVEKSWTDPITGKFKEGNPGGGRPKGAKSFETDFNEAVKEIAELNKITPSEARKILFKVAFSEARKGNYNFYKDTIDRIYGKALDKGELDLTTAGEKLPTPICYSELTDEQLQNEIKRRDNRISPTA